jgi:UDP-3-O-acyl-N-acetylglucosamine deacetylase
VRYVLRYPKPVGTQEHTYTSDGPEVFKNEIAPARTFGFLRDIEKLQDAGLVSGGKLNNCILIDDEKIINTDLRFPNEFARHKILDILGDFYLLGRPIRGAITAHMTGHSDNIALVRELRQAMEL